MLRRNGWATAQDLEEAAARSTGEGDQMPTTSAGSAP
jgi:hypothetical protein